MPFLGAFDKYSKCEIIYTFSTSKVQYNLRKFSTERGTQWQCLSDQLFFRQEEAVVINPVCTQIVIVHTIGRKFFGISTVRGHWVIAIKDGTLFSRSAFELSKSWRRRMFQKRQRISVASFYFRTFFKYVAVCEPFTLATSSGVPFATTVPPSSPPSGPKSIM